MVKRHSFNNRLRWGLILFAQAVLAGHLTAATHQRPDTTNIAPSFSTKEVSLYPLTSPWTNDFGKVQHLSDFEGHPVLIALFFSQCKSICPMLVGQLKQVEERLPPNLKQHFRFVLITMDVERDSVGALHAYRQHLDLSSTDWTLLRGSADDTRELAYLLGVDYQPGAKGQLEHRGQIALLNRHGKVIFKTAQIENASNFVEQMKKLNAADD